MTGAGAGLLCPVLVGDAEALGIGRGVGVRAETLRAAPDPPRRASYQPCWVALGHVSAQAGRRDAAAVRAMQRAIGMTSDPAVRLHLQQQGRRWAAATADEAGG